MENYVAIVVDNDAKAFESLYDLWNLDAAGDITVHGATVIHRDKYGYVDVAKRTAGANARTGSGIGSSALLGALGSTNGAGSSGLGADATSVFLPRGRSAVIAEVTERQTIAIDDLAAHAGGTIFRRAKSDLRGDARYDFAMRSLRRYGLAVVLALWSCAQNPSGGTSALPLAAGQTAQAHHRVAHRGDMASQIQHVVIIVQENRTVDDLFQFLPGANTQSWGYNSSWQQVSLQPENLAAAYDLSHIHTYFSTEYNGGNMNGFDLEQCKGKCVANAAYAYVPQSQVQPYYTLAETYAFADNMFESDQGPSFVSHQYLISGTSTTSTGSANKASNNPEDPEGDLVGGCDSPQGSLVGVINPKGAEPQNLKMYPCFQRLSIMNEMDAAGVSWKYYQATQGAGLWNAPDAIQSIWSNPSEMASNVISPSSQVLTDIANGNLASVVWVTPTQAASDHPKVNNGSGPSWVASVVNAIGSSQYWSNTAIFITWDDWGGFYDHVSPTIYNSFELGFRVPLVVVSPYAKPGYVSHGQHEFGSILKFVEETFNLPSLGTTDVRADDLSDCFDFTQPMIRYKHVATKYPPRYFATLPAAEPKD